MKAQVLTKSFSLAFNNLWRNKLLSIATIFVIASIIFIFNIILAINFIAENALSDLNQKVDITVYIKESTSTTKAQEIAEEIAALPGVTEVEFTSKDTALEQLKSSHPDLSIAFEKYNLDNPLPASLSITTEKAEQHSYIASYLNDEKFSSYLSNIISNDDSSTSTIFQEVSNNLIQLTQFTKQIIFWLFFTFILGGTLIILNALQITIFNRKKEISVMKLVGASHGFIRAPFVIEAILYAILATILSFIFLFALSKQVDLNTTSLWGYYSELDYTRIILIEMAVAITLSVFSSIIAVSEYINQDLLED